MTNKEIKIQLALGTLPDKIKMKLSWSETTSKRILAILAIDKDWFVRWRVADNPNTPKKSLAILLKDDDWRVKEFLVRKGLI